MSGSFLSNAAGRSRAAPAGLAVLFLCCLASGVIADESRGSDPIDTLVVTPTLTERSLEQTAVSITVLDDAIRLQQPRDLADLLRAQPGVDVVSNGGFGKATSVFLRGASNSQSLLLVDGVRMGSATAGGPSWQYLPPQLLERVEIVRGPRGAIYGADAIGGVVQVFTRDEPDRGVSARIGGGSFATRDVGAGFGAGGDTFSVQAAANHFETDGIALRPGGEDKGYDNTSVFTRLDARPAGDALELGMTLLRSQGNTEFVGGHSDYVHQSLGARVAYRFGEHWRTRMTFGESRDESENFQSFGDSVFDTRLRTFRLLNAADFGDHELVFGADYREDAVESTVDFAQTSRDNVGAFAQLAVSAGGFELQPAVRWDDNEAYGSEWTGALAAAFELDDAHRLRASVGTAFRAPTFNDLYFPGFSNPDLEPETSRTIELGGGGRYAGWHWDAAVFQTDVDELIALEVIDGAFVPLNVDEARIRGLEIEAGMALANGQLSLAYTHNDPVNRSSGNRLVRRTRNSLRLDADTRHGAWSFGASLIAQSHRYNDPGASERLGGFGLVNLRLGRGIGRDWSLRVTLDNVLDRDYALARDSFAGFDFQQPGRAAFVRLTYGER